MATLVHCSLPPSPPLSLCPSTLSLLPPPPPHLCLYPSPPSPLSSLTHANVSEQETFFVCSSINGMLIKTTTFSREPAACVACLRKFFSLFFSLSSPPPPPFFFFFFFLGHQATANDAVKLVNKILLFLGWRRRKVVGASCLTPS